MAKRKNTGYTSEPRKMAVLVYQAGIANVFEVQCFNMAPFGRDAKRILQSDFRTCESYVRGLAHAGYLITSAHCNRAGDIADQKWDAYLPDAPFFDHMQPFFHRVLPDY